MGKYIITPDELDWDKMDNLIPAVAQDSGSGEIKMLAYMSPESLEETLKTGRATYWSRSIKGLWVKGETSGNVQLINGIRADCDGDALVLEINPLGPACHKIDENGNYMKSCFYRRIK